MKDVLEVIKRVLKKVKLSTVLLLFFLLSTNVFAWFIYTTKVDSNITAHVKAWDISFTVGSTELSQEINFDITEVYPGMTPYHQKITATNNSETKAKFTYEIISASILGETYKIGSNLTSEELSQKLANDYPFKVIFNTDNHLMESHGGKGEFSLSVTWPYESGDDAKDTYWGNKAYLFKKSNASVPSISLVVKINAIQVEE